MTVSNKRSVLTSMRLYFILMVLAAAAAMTAGCDWFDDDDCPSAGGAGTQTSNTTPTPAPAADPPPQPQPDPKSTDSKSYPSLAGTGIVWKPVSEGNHMLVVLTPTSYGNPGAVVLDTNNKAIEAGRYVGHTNGNRATYRFTRPGGAFPAPCRLQIGSSIFTVAHPGSRYN